MKKLLVLIVLLSQSSNAYCVYVDCSPLVASLLSKYQAKSTSEFAKLTAKKVTLQIKYNNYVVELDRFIELQKQDMKLKSAILLQLKKKEKMLDARVKMFFLKTKKDN